MSARRKVDRVAVAVCFAFASFTGVLVALALHPSFPIAGRVFTLGMALVAFLVAVGLWAITYEEPQ